MLHFVTAAFHAFFSVFILCIILVSASADSSISADLYRWTDEEGIVHFSDHPPQPSTSKGKDVKVLRMPDRSSRSSTSMEEQDREYIIPFKRAFGGMLVDVVINDGVPARMIVDTGATTVKINVSLFKKLNQNLPAKLRKGKMLTAAGAVDAQELFIEKIDLGGAAKSNVQAAFIDEAYDYPQYDGLLGLSFLSDFKMTIDYEKNVILLRRRIH